MDENIFVFEFDVLRFGTNEKLKTYHCLAYNLFQATHIITEFLYLNENSEFKEPTEIGCIRRLTGINYIINPDFYEDMLELEEMNSDYDGSIPLKVAKNLTDEEVMQFDCGNCGDPIRAPKAMTFPYLTCPTCNFDMARSDIKSAGNLYYYEKTDKK